MCVSNVFVCVCFRCVFRGVHACMHAHMRVCVCVCVCVCQLPLSVALTIIITILESLCACAPTVIKDGTQPLLNYYY